MRRGISNQQSPCSSTIESLPATLDLQDRLSGATDGDILEGAALELNAEPRGRGKGPRPQGRIDSPSLVHGLWVRLARPAEGEGRVNGVVRCSDGLSQVNSGSARDWALNWIRKALQDWHHLVDFCFLLFFLALEFHVGFLLGGLGVLQAIAIYCWQYTASST